MTQALTPFRNARMSAVVRAPSTRGVWAVAALGGISRQRLATDTIGNVAITLTNVVIGSAIRVEVQSTGAALATATAAATDVLINVPVYAPGDPKNNIRVKVRKGSASPFYQPWETLATSVVGASSIYVAQISDE